MKFDKVLVPVDFSKGTSLALEYALGLAKVMGSQLTLLHVFELPMGLVAYLPRGESAKVREKFRSLRAEKLERLQRHDWFSSDVEVTTKLVEGGTAREILHETKEGGFDLVVLSAKDHKTISGRFGPSVVECLARNAPCPILVLKADEEDTPSEEQRFELSSDLDLIAKIARVLFPTDLSSVSLEALGTAAAIGDKFQASVDVLHVVEENVGMSWELLGVTPEEYFARAEEIGEERVKAAIEDRIPGLNWVNCEVERGDPAEEIVRLSKEGKYDLLVLGTHGRKGLSRLILGSVAEKVIRRAACPVLAIPVGERAATANHAEATGGR